MNSLKISKDRQYNGQKKKGKKRQTMGDKTQIERHESH